MVVASEQRITIPKYKVIAIPKTTHISPFCLLGCQIHKLDDVASPHYQQFHLTNNTIKDDDEWNAHSIRQVCNLPHSTWKSNKLLSAAYMNSNDIKEKLISLIETETVSFGRRIHGLQRMSQSWPQIDPRITSARSVSKPSTVLCTFFGKKKSN